MREGVHSNYDNHPAVAVSGRNDACWQGWDAITAALRERRSAPRRFVVVVECYPGTLDDELLPALRQRLQPDLLIESSTAMLPASAIDQMVASDLTDDPVFGRISDLRLEQFFDADKLRAARQRIAAADGLILIYGTGAALLADADLTVYADLARWELQQRFRRDQIPNLGVENRSTKASLQYKRAFFVDWRVCDRHKRELFERIDFFVDTNIPAAPKMARGDAVRDALRQTARRPFRVVPFFDPAPWGGQWMKAVCDLDRAAPNYGWCFDCVPEENSLLLDFGKTRIEIPSIDLVFYQPLELLGDNVHERFGAEFPIRFDFLDTMGGGNLSLQVHPLTQYIREHFAMAYTQDESYYLLDAGDDATVYLG